MTPANLEPSREMLDNEVVTAVRERIRMADGWSKSTGYPAHDYFDVMMDLRRMMRQFDHLRTELADRDARIERLVEALDRNTKPGYPCEADTGECYYCGDGLCEDQDGYQDDELCSPKFHKPDCAWRQARELLAALSRLDAEKDKP